MIFNIIQRQFFEVFSVFPLFTVWHDFLIGKQQIIRFVQVHYGFLDITARFLLVFNRQISLQSQKEIHINNKVVRKQESIVNLFKLIIKPLVQFPLFSFSSLKNDTRRDCPKFRVNEKKSELKIKNCQSYTANFFLYHH